MRGKRKHAWPVCGLWVTLGIRTGLAPDSKLTQQTSGGLAAVDPVQGQGEGSILGERWLREIGREQRGSGADGLGAQYLGTSSPRPHRCRAAVVWKILSGTQGGRGASRSASRFSLPSDHCSRKAASENDAIWVMGERERDAKGSGKRAASSELLFPSSVPLPRCSLSLAGPAKGKPRKPRKPDLLPPATLLDDALDVVPPAVAARGALDHVAAHLAGPT